MDGIGGRPGTCHERMIRNDLLILICVTKGWAWIFILEGLATVILAAASFWIVEDFPDNAKFLTETEREHLVRCMRPTPQLTHYRAQGCLLSVACRVIASKAPEEKLSNAIMCGRACEIGRRMLPVGTKSPDAHTLRTNPTNVP